MHGFAFWLAHFENSKPIREEIPMYPKKPSMLFLAIVNPGFTRFETTKYGLKRSYDLLLHKHSILNLAAFLRENGCDAHYAWTECPDERGIVEFKCVIDKLKPDAIGMSLCTNEFMIHYRFLERLKRTFRRLPVIVGGPHVSALPFHTLTNFPAIDCIATGDGEHTLAQWLRVKASKDRHYKMREIGGLGYREESGEIFLTAQRKRITDINILPEPAYDLIIKDGATLDSKTVFPIFCSYGCRFHCTFCAADHGNYRFFTPDRVAERIEKVYNSYHVKHFSIMDGLWPPSRAWLNEFCDEIERRKIRAGFEFATRAESLREQDFHRLKRIGAETVVVGIESGDEGILRRIKKGITKETALKAFQAIHDAGIFSAANFMVGNAGETVETIERTIEFASELNPSIALFRAHCPIPGTEAFEYVDESERDYWMTGSGEKDWWMQSEIPSVCDLPFKELQKIAEGTYLNYPLRLEYLRRHVITGWLPYEYKKICFGMFLKHLRKLAIGTMERFRVLRGIIRRTRRVLKAIFIH
ncbi:MAG TPA: radical SAM protein [Firmicutes bacterium]|nr:radical SAM protein [Bacillota bacterium]